MNGEPSEAQGPLNTEEGDWFLRALVQQVTNTETEIGITLHVSGSLVSGNLVSSHKYFEAFASDFAAAFSRSFPDDHDAANDIKETYLEYGNIQRQLEAQTDGLRGMSYIHLKEASLFSSAGEPFRVSSFWWRGRISQVSGFNLGRFSAGKG